MGRKPSRPLASRSMGKASLPRRASQHYSRQRAAFIVCGKPFLNILFIHRAGTYPRFAGGFENAQDINNEFDAVSTTSAFPDTRRASVLPATFAYPERSAYVRESGFFEDQMSAFRAANVIDAIFINDNIASHMQQIIVIDGGDVLVGKSPFQGSPPCPRPPVHFAPGPYSSHRTPRRWPAH